MAMSFEFPNPVNETSARLVATGVVLMALAFAVTQSGWVLVPLTYGFLARVLYGPRFSPLGRLMTEVVTPRLNLKHRFVPGPPKRFAQGIGLLFTSVASVAWLAGAHTLATVVIVMLIVAASLEAFAGFCLGCAVFGWLMKVGIIPDEICLECSDFSRRLTTTK